MSKDYFNIDTHIFTSRLQNKENRGNNKWQFSCPCANSHKNSDGDQSMSVEYSPSTGKIAVYCHTGCKAEDIVSAVGCKMSDLFTRKDLNASIAWYAGLKKLKFVDAYDYSYPGDGLFKVKFLKENGKKVFGWVHEDPKSGSGFRWNRDGFRNRLFVSGNLSDEKICICEGEKDCLTVHNLTGMTSVCSEDGATKGRAGKKWVPEYNTQLSGKTVYIFFDNDDAGINFLRIEAEQLTGKAKSVHVCDIRKVWNGCPDGGDITDLADTVGSEKLKAIFPAILDSAVSPEEFFQESFSPVTDDVRPEDTPRTEPETLPEKIVVHTVPAQPETKQEDRIRIDDAEEDDEPGENLPAWITEAEYNGRVSRKIDEPLFCEIFKKENDIVRINGVFYLGGKQTSDELILSMIQKQIKPYFPEKTGRKTNDVFLTLQNEAYIQQPEPDEHKVYIQDGKTLNIDNDGSVTVTEEKIFTLTRLPVTYNPAARCPMFERYLSELLYPEDIPTVQEYLGYCLIPSTRAQAGLFLHGSGGEGKTVLTDIVVHMFGHSAIQEGIHNLSGRFVLANLENRLVCVDDDMRTSLLNETSTIKQIITNRPTKPIQVERKNKQKYDSYIFARIFAVGNSFIGSKFDHSDGFYRRQLLIDCKPKSRTTDDRFLSEKLFSETEGIFNWALAGLTRLIKNGFSFTVSDRMKQTLDDVKHDGDNSLTFFEDDSVISITGEWSDQIPSADLFAAYVLWCTANAETPMRRKSFLIRCGERFKPYKIRIDTKNGRSQGYSHLRFSKMMAEQIQHLDERTTERINRLP